MLRHTYFQPKRILTCVQCGENAYNSTNFVTKMFPTRRDSQSSNNGLATISGEELKHTGFPTQCYHQPIIRADTIEQKPGPNVLLTVHTFTT